MNGGGDHRLADAAAALDLELTDDDVPVEEHQTPGEPTYF